MWTNITKKKLSFQKLNFYNTKSLCDLTLLKKNYGFKS